MRRFLNMPRDTSKLKYKVGDVILTSNNVGFGDATFIRNKIGTIIELQDTRAHYVVEIPECYNDYKGTYNWYLYENHIVKRILPEYTNEFIDEEYESMLV